MKPLDAHPELSVLIPAEGVLEFRVENWRLRKGSRVPLEGPGLDDLIFVVCASWTWYKFGLPNSIAYFCSWVCVLSLYLYSKCIRILHESIIVLPPYGVQLETHRGLKPPFVKAFPLVGRRRFIPFTSMHDIVINEGLRRWDVRYYICVIRDTGSKMVLDVAFENTLPSLPVLKFIYNEIKDLIQKDPPHPGPTD